MARLGLVVAALAGCNSVLGNDRAFTRDARYFDAPVDAPFACPAAGSSPAELSPELHGVFIQDCLDYSFQGDRASASCTDVGGIRQIYEGPRDGPLTLVAAIREDSLTVLHDQPRLSPDGTRLYARRT